MEGRTLAPSFWLRIVGWLGFAAAAPFIVRLLYEQTLLTWQEGVQSVGFTIAHIYPGLLVFGLAGGIVAHVWLFVFIITAVYRKHRQVKIPVADWSEFAVLLLLVVLFYVPYGWWQYCTIKVAGRGHNSAAQLSYATMDDQRYLVEALLNAGVPVDAPGPYARTALNEACRAGRLDLARYLASRGADVNRAPDCRRYSEFESKMKTTPAPITPASNLPEVPGVTVEVH